MAKALNLAVRVLIAVVVGACLIRWAGFSILLPFVGAFYGLILFLLFGLPLVKRAGTARVAAFLARRHTFPHHARVQRRGSASEGRKVSGSH